MILSGTQVADTLYTQLSEQISHLGVKPTLGAILVGESAASLRYIRQKRKFAQLIGMNFQLIQFPETISEAQLMGEIQKLNKSNDISGYIVQLPLPSHIDTLSVISHISPDKDVDGFHPINQGKIMIGDDSGFHPCTPAGVMKLFDHYEISLAGKKICILGKSNIVGKPLAMMCINAGATVISCNSKTPDISHYTQDADIIICATGIPHILSPEMTNSESIIIDVGFSVVDGKIRGDAMTEKFTKQGNLITPVPGGVGPMTVAMLMNNTYLAHIKHHES